MKTLPVTPFYLSLKIKAYVKPYGKSNKCRGKCPIPQENHQTIKLCQPC